MESKFAPIALFVYKRMHHVKKIIQALQSNTLAQYSDLIIYSDGAKGEDDAHEVNAIRNFLHTIEGFNSVNIITRDKNYGLAKNIIDGVTEAINEYGKIIVIEDDILVSPKFLNFMNRALDFYEKNERVWHISGWNYPISATELEDVYFGRVMNCWGWATWKDRWNFFNKDPERLVKSWTSKQKYCFDLYGSGIFWPQIIANYRNKLDTWAIFWYATIYENNGLCLYPSISYVDNIGHDGTGTNCEFKASTPNLNLNINASLNFTPKVEESEIALNRVIKYYKNEKIKFLARVLNKVIRIFVNHPKKMTYIE